MAKYDIKIDLDAKCKRCGKGGATPSGLCLACISKAIVAGELDHILKPLQDKVKKDIKS